METKETSRRKRFRVICTSAAKTSGSCLIYGQRGTFDSIWRPQGPLWNPSLWFTRIWCRDRFFQRSSDSSILGTLDFLSLFLLSIWASGTGVDSHGRCWSTLTSVNSLFSRIFTSIEWDSVEKSLSTGGNRKREIRVFRKQKGFPFSRITSFREIRREAWVLKDLYKREISLKGRYSFFAKVVGK